MAPLCVCVCVCETKALQPGVQQEWGTKQTTQKKVRSNQPDTHMTESLDKPKFRNSDPVFVQYRKIKIGPFQPMTQHVRLQS